MPLSIYNKFGIEKTKPTNVILHLVDQIIRYPYGAIEGVLVKVGKLVLSTNFAVLDMDDDDAIPLILGRSFLATGRALINMDQGGLILRIKDEMITFKVCDERSIQERKEHYHRKRVKDFDKGNASRYENPSQPKKSALYEPPWRKWHGKDCVAAVTLSNKVNQEREEFIRKTWRKTGDAGPNRASIT